MFLNIEGEQIFVYAEETNKPKVLFFHGFNSGSFFINHLKHLKRDYDIIAIDFPGCGKSSHNSQLSLDLYIKVARGVVQNLNLESLIVVGHSLGAASALSVADMPSVKEIVLLSPFNPYILDKVSKQEMTWMLLPESIEEAIKSLSLLVANKEKTEYYENISKSAISYSKQISLKKLILSPLVLNYITNEEYLSTELYNLYTKSQNIHILTGDGDNFTSLDSVIKSSKLVKNPNLVILKNTGHAIVYEQPSIINDFFNELI